MRILCIDCEGPITLNDNAFEICQHFLPRGDNFFRTISSYDDYLADVIKKKGYAAGGTLRLITPFFKAYGLTGEKIRTFSRKTLRLVPGAKDMLEKLKSCMKVFVVSTSYTPYIQALCKLLNFPLENTFSTFLDLDSFPLPEKEREKLIYFYQRINSLHLPPPAGKKDISFEERKTIRELDEIFFKKIPLMRCGAIMDKVIPVGGKEKENAVKKILYKVKAKPQDTIYVGDSITDARALRFLREKGGISLSFNGNIYALREAEFALISSHSYALFLIVKKFNEKGKDALSEIASSWPQILDREEREKLNSLAPGSIFARINADSLSSLLRMSEGMRKKLRGEKIGALG